MGQVPDSVHVTEEQGVDSKVRGVAYESSHGLLNPGLGVFRGDEAMVGHGKSQAQRQQHADPRPPRHLDGILLK